MILLHFVEIKRFAAASTVLARVGDIAKVTWYAGDDRQFDALNHEHLA
jgi:hypothetical protein